MYKLDEFFSVLDRYAPLKISHKMIEKGDYDNSGIIVKCLDEVKSVLFSLDLSKLAVEKAKACGCDTIVTHHPAIYQPIKSLKFDSDTAPLVYAVMNGMNVISMHLNLDMAEFGIDYYLAKALGATKETTLDYIDDGVGYGREFDLSTSVRDLVKKLSNELNTDKIIAYGKGEVKKVASFCGGGASYALKFVESNIATADTIVTSDMPHHVIKELIERDKKIIIIPHYVSEEIGFSKFYEEIKKQTGNKIQTYYFDDKRFR